MSLAGIALISAAVIVGLLLLSEPVARSVGRGLLATVINGQDGRTSTSKTFIFMWTLLVGWALIALLIAGEFTGVHRCLVAGHATAAALTRSTSACARAGDPVGLLQAGWFHFLRAGLAGGYLVLLGVPAAAGVAAKGITQSRVQNGTAVKQPTTRQGATARVAEIFSADDGTTDIGDLQYVIFNVITAGYFVAQFLNPDGSGLPMMPDTLLGLTSVSASLYVGKKAIADTQPQVTGVFPMPLRDGQTFTVIGAELTVDPASPTDARPQVSIDGVLAQDVVMVGANLTAKAPPNLAPGGSPTIRTLRVLNPYGGLTADYPVQCQ
ncbi:MAG TPA: hypothetical protein VFN55_17285 [Solirubrobacteraceae bacterium]|nr:hypothetical protein [Solirubrobacteraceae bacterium]